MKRVLIPLTLMIGLAGCVTPPAEPIGAERTTGVPAAPVRPDQVTPQTAHKLSQALTDELDREAQHEIAAPGLPKR